jgi:hypothetical protein
VRPLAPPPGRPGILFFMHLRAPSTDQGVRSFLWALLFFVILYFGMVAIAVAHGTAFLLSLVLSFLIFLFVRTRGT